MLNVKRILATLVIMASLSVIPVVGTAQAPAGNGAEGYSELIELFREWREFERRPRRDNAPDYTASTMAAQLEGLKDYRQRLYAIDIGDWPVPEQIDWHLVRAEMNGMEFNIRALKSWQRDPAFYASVWTFQSDTPAHEGPNHHALIELWTYDFPLSSEDSARLASELAGIKPLLEQARINLTGNARELWIGGITNIREQADALRDLAGRVPETDETLHRAIDEALGATESFVGWLQQNAESKDGPSGISKELYTWHLRNVLLVPLSWDEERYLLRRELDRAHATLKLVEHRNAHLPPQVPIADEQEYAQRAELAVLEFRDFLVDKEILPPYPYIEPALRGQMGQFVPADQRNFFYMVSHHDLLALWTHWYHWFDLARMEANPHPSPVRRGPLLYNIWMSRAEGMATGFEEMMMHAGLFDNSPRSKELVYIMLAQRAARGLGSLFAHANEYTLKQARDFHVEWTPRGWMREDLDLLGFEQLLYLRQPAYGTSYVTGKYMIERLLKEVAHERGDQFRLRDFFAELDEAGVIPVSLIRWQMTGRDDEIRSMMSPEWTAWPGDTSEDGG